jgi:hypothetical protein
MTCHVVLCVRCQTIQYINQYAIIFEDAFTLFMLAASVYFFIKLLVLCMVMYRCELFCGEDLHFFKVEV